MRDAKRRIETVLRQAFPNNEIAPRHFGELLVEYAESGVGPPNLVNEIETGGERALWSFAWEAMLCRHLRTQGYEPKGTAKRTGGPDFRIEHAGRTIWIEAVVPAPEDVPADYLEPPPAGKFRLRSKPDAERVLRCMSVIADKRYKVDGYLAKGIIGAADCVIIAVNICRLSDLDPDGNGITRMPLSMEAVFPIGPLVVPISSDGKIDGPMQNAPRFAVRKASGEPIKTTAFLDPAFVNISAVIQAHQKDMHERDLVLATIHNPLALNPLPTGLLGAQKEFVALAHGDDYQLRDVRLEARLQELTESLTRRFLAREDRIVRPVTAAEAGDFVGERNKCKENVNNWCFIREHFQHVPVRGWLISGDCVLDKHSVVDIGGGELVDVTPMPEDGARLTFLPHDGNEDEFAAMPNQLILAR